MKTPRRQLVLASWTLLISSASCASNVFPVDAGANDGAVQDSASDARVIDTVIVDVPSRSEPAEGYIEAITDMANGMSSSVDAHFYSRAGMPPCRVATDGNCTFRLCDRGDGGFTYPGVSAGDVTVGDDAHQRLLVLPYRASSMDYASEPLGANYWPTAARVDMRGAGDVYSAFELSLHFPAPTTLVGFMPEFDSRSVVIDRSRDMPLRWMSGSNGTLTVTISVGTSDSSAHLECRFDATFPAGTISMSQLALLPITGPDAGFIDISVVDRMDVVHHDRSGVDQVLHARVGYALFRESAGTR